MQNNKFPNVYLFYGSGKTFSNYEKGKLDVLYLGGRLSFWRVILLRREPAAGCVLTLRGVSRELLSTCDTAAAAAADVSDELEAAGTVPTHNKTDKSCPTVEAQASLICH